MSKQIRKTIAEEPFFSGLEESWLDFLADNATDIQLDANEIVSRQGSRADRFFLVLEGELAIEVPAIQGPTLEVQRLRPGQILGWSWLIEPFRWHFQSRASGPTHLLSFDGEAILARCEEDPAFGYALLKRFSTLMGQRLESAQRKMMDQWSPAGFA